ncbi:MAG: Gfo/Idh/MocA family protein [Lacipirellulaceae bacterium]
MDSKNSSRRDSAPNAHPALGVSRRGFLGAAAALAAAQTVVPRIARAQSAATVSPNEKPVLGYIGTGIRYTESLGPLGIPFGPAAAVADVDLVQLGRGVQTATNAHFEHGHPISISHYQDYRRVLDRQDVDVVFVASPDHWHAKHLIEAMRAGKDVYCEKPLTYSIGEGRRIRDAVRETGRVVQVGSQQRTEFDGMFAKAAAIVRAGRVGKVKRITVALGGPDAAEPLPVAPVPRELDWDQWLGPAPTAQYRQGNAILATGYGAGFPLSRTHKYFRWWYEYSGGKMTDWGIHHTDVALWAVNLPDDQFGPYRVEPLSFTHPVELVNGMPSRDDMFNTAETFHIKVTFAGGIEFHLRDNAPELGFDNGILFEGERGKLFVNRGKLTGKPVEELATNPLPEDAITKLYGRPAPASHMADFFECVRTRQTPISDVASHCRHLDVCHAANIAMRLGKTLVFDPLAEKFDDARANDFVFREPRKGFEFPA